MTTDTISKLTRSNMIIYQILLIELFIFGAVAWFIISKGIIDVAHDPKLELIFLVVFIVIGAGEFIAGRMITRTRLKYIKAKTDLEEKLMDFRGLAIVQWALVEGMGFFGIVIFLVTGEQSFLLFTLLAIAIMFALSPTAGRISRLLNLSDRERDQLNSGK